MVNDDLTVELLVQILDAHRTTNQALAGLKRAVERCSGVAAVQVAKPLSEADSGRLLTLLPEIAAAIGDAPFLVDDLRERAGIDAALALVLRDIDARRFGHLMARAAGHTVAGNRVERVRETRDGVVWRVVAAAS